MKPTLLLLMCCVLLLPVQAYEGETKVHVLDNGLVVIMKETHVAPMVSFQAWVKAGSITEREKTGSGLSHYFEHMLFKGTSKYKPGEISQTIHKAGGADLNAYTTFDRTVYHFTVLSEFTDTGLDVLSGMLTDSVFDPQEAEKELLVIIKEINMVKDEPSRRLFQELFATSYQELLYRHPVIGYEDAFRKLTRDDIMDYYRTMYSPSNVIISLVGDFELALMTEKVNSYFSAWKRLAVPPPQMPEEPAQLSYRYREIEDQVPFPRFYMGYHTVDMFHPDAPALDVLSGILGSGDTSRLYRRLVETGTAKAVSSSTFNPRQGPGLFTVMAFFDEKNYSAVRSAVLDEINLLKEKEAAPAELAKVKNSIIAGEIFDQESISRQAATLAGSYFYTAGLDMDKKYIEKIKGLSATDIKRVALKYLHFDSLSLVQMKPRKERSTLADLKQNARETSVVFDVREVTLPGGAVLLLLEDHKLPIISASATFIAGLLCETATENGISSLAATMLTRGTASFPRRSIDELVANTGSLLNASSGHNTLQVELKTLKDNFSQLWPVFSGIIKENRFTDEDFSREKALHIAGLQNADQDINKRCDKLFRKLIYAGHPFARPVDGTESSVAGLTALNVSEFIAKHMMPSNMVLSIAGDFSASEMELLVRKTFDTSSGKAFQRPPLSSPVKLDRVLSETEKMPDKAQCIVQLGFPGVNNTHDDGFVMDVISQILSGLGSRLFENLRSKHSLAYSVGAWPFKGFDTGSFYFYIATVPEKREFALAKMKEEIEQLKKVPVPPDELEKAKNKIAGGEARKFQSTLGLASDLGLSRTYWGDWRPTFTVKDRIKAVTSEDIMRVSKKYFDLDKCVIAVVEP
ncbi:MAG: pitrilysin family protein [Candidatus Wallbacteria bacterium]|nr:pitrilysin family protein [Candidatus Wallbacteria bacterium]